jgi:hypothetical protein
MTTAIVLFVGRTALHAQLPVVHGNSMTQSGMIYYDVNGAEDKGERIYSYTVCPDSAGCIQLDFNLIRSDQAMGGQVEGAETGKDFIRVFDGPSNANTPIAGFGTIVGTKFLQTSGGCVTVEFTRDAKGLNSVWTAMWRGRSPAECIRPLEDNACTDVQDICGPDFHENFHYFGKHSRSSAPPATACLQQSHNASWYRFAIAQTGKLQFEIVPDNGFDDFDWVLLKADPSKPGDCPSLPEVNARLACNNAAGRGHAGATGMGEKGQDLNAGSSGNPYCQPLAVEKGDVFFLFIDDYSKHSSGFTIKFNEVVLHCANPQKDFLQVAWNSSLKQPAVDPRKSFTKYTRVLRIDLSEKANLPLAQSQHPSQLFDKEFFGAAKTAGTNPQFFDERGTVPALMNGLKLGWIQAYAAHDFRSPLHYGDLLDLAQRQFAGTNQEARNWWDPPKEDLEGFNQVLELIVDETFDKISGIKRQQIRYVRILWTDRDGKAPDFNVAVFDYTEVQDLLDRIPIQNGHNDANAISIKDFLENQMYNGVVVERSSRSVNSLQQSKFSGDRQIELESYIWDR